MIRQVICVTILGMLMGRDNLFGAVIPVTDANVLKGLSPYNWVCREDSIIAAVNGASLSLRFKGTRQAALHVATDHMATRTPTRFPIIAWSVNGGVLQSHQLAANEDSVLLSADVPNPTIEVYIKGMSPFEDRYTGDVPGNALRITGFAVDAGASTMTVAFPGKIWLNIGDSLLSGDGATYASGQGRPPDDLWPASEDGRASYGYLLAQHYGYREARIAYGGYNWGGGMANMPALSTVIDQKTSTTSRLQGDVLNPPPDIVLINLGENGAPAEADVFQALRKLRHRVPQRTKIIVMIPVSGRARAEVTRAFNSYKNSAKDENAYLVDLGQVTFATCDGQHPTAAGQQAIYEAALPALDPIVGKAKK
jgi:lysophospholipase L1-like esterase